MKYIKRPVVLNAVPYVYCETDIVDASFQLSESELAVTWKKEAGKKYKGIPYITGEGGRQYILPGSLIMTDERNRKIVIDKDKFLSQHIQHEGTDVKIVNELKTEIKELREANSDLESINEELAKQAKQAKQTKQVIKSKKKSTKKDSGSPTSLQKSSINDIDDPDIDPRDLI